MSSHSDFVLVLFILNTTLIKGLYEFSHSLYHSLIQLAARAYLVRNIAQILLFININNAIIVIEDTLSVALYSSILEESAQMKWQIIYFVDNRLTT